jgi:hypothetical protein
VVVDGFEEMMVAPGGQCPATIFLPSVTGNSNDDEGARVFLTKPGCDLEAIEPRQSQMEKHKTGPLALRDRDGLVSITSDLDITAAEPLAADDQG